MPKFEDLTGREFGRLTVISRAPNNKHGQTMWKCRCSCKDQTIITVVAYALKSGNTQSCGCLKHEGLHTTHGKRHDKIYQKWLGIKQRCTNPNHKFYKNYGGRGIKIFEAWLEFEPFYDYVSKLEHFGEKGYTLDRINNDGNYEPDNVRWVDRKTQNRNKRTNRLVEYNGEQMTLAEAAELSGIKYMTLHRRYERGDRGERLFRSVKK